MIEEACRIQSLDGWGQINETLNNVRSETGKNDDLDPVRVDFSLFEYRFFKQ